MEYYTPESSCSDRGPFASPNWYQREIVHHGFSLSIFIIFSFRGLYNLDHGVQKRNLFNSMQTQIKNLLLILKEQWLCWKLTSLHKSNVLF